VKTSRKRVSRRRTSLRRNFRPRVGQKAQVSIGYGEWITGTVIKARKGEYEVEVPSKTGSTIYGSSATHLRAAHGRRTSLRRNGKTPTFQAAKNAVMANPEGQGWRVSGALKVPHATSPDGVVRLWFKPQAVWASVDQQGRSHTLGEARSVHSDIRAETPAGFAAGAVQSALRLDATLRQGGFRPNLASAGKSRRQLSSRGNSNDGSPTRGNSNDGSPL